LAGLVLSLAPQLQVQCLLPNNADPHHFQLTPRQVTALQQTRLLIRSPRDDKFWPGLHTQAPTFELWPTQKHLHHESNHAWLNPQQVLRALPKLADNLMLTFPESKPRIKQALEQSQMQVKIIWKQWQNLVVSTHLKQRGVMMQHPSWQTLFEALDVPIRYTLESAQHGQEFGPKKLEKALAILTQHPNTVLIGDSNHSNRALQWLNKRTAQPIVKLDALGSCGESWVKLMQRNLDTLQAALKP